MADLLTIIGTLVTAGTIAASITKQVHNLVESFKSAPTAIRTLHEELIFHSRTLTQLKVTCSPRLEAGETFKDGVVEILSAALALCEPTLLKVEKALQKKFPGEESNSTKRVRTLLGVKPESLNQARWFFEKDKFLSLQRELGRITSSLNTALVLVVM